MYSKLIKKCRNQYKSVVSETFSIYRESNNLSLHYNLSVKVPSQKNADVQWTNERSV